MPMFATLAPPAPLTVEDFESLLRLPANRDRLLELIHGELHEKMPTQEHGLIAANLTIALGAYLKPLKLGRLGIEVRHRAPDDPHNDRLPDIAFSLDRQTPLVKRGPVPAMPDFAIEIKSPDDTYTLMREKAAYYLQHGTRLVWLVYPDKRMVEVYQAGADIAFFLMGDTLTGGDLLPDFCLPVADIFPE